MCVVRSINERNLRNLTLDSTLTMRFQASRNLAVASTFQAKYRTFFGWKTQIMLSVSATLSFILVTIFILVDFVDENWRLLFETIAAAGQNV